MLPPVRAISLFPEATPPALQPAAKLQPVHATAANDHDASMPVSGGRLGAMSLSVQLQLAQGLSIFAETIGALLKLPRGRDEGLDDYAQRIAAAVEALDPPARAQLETALNQLVRGATLRLLADMLKDPAGPDAARLATLLENPASVGKDLAAKAAVTSYLQNEGRDARAPGSGARPVQPSTPTGAAPPPTTSSTASLPVPSGAALPRPDLAPLSGEIATEPLVLAGKTGTVPSAAAGSVTTPSASAGSLAPAPTPAIPAASAPIFERASALAPGATPAVVSAMPVPDAVGPPAPTINPAVLASLDAAADLAVPNVDLEVIKAEAIAVAGALAKLPLSILTGRATTDLALPAPGSAIPDLASIDDPGETPISIPLRDPLLELKAGRAAGGFDSNPVLAITEWLVENFIGRPLPPAAPASPMKPERSGADALIASLIAGPPATPPVAVTDHGALPGKTSAMPDAGAAPVPVGPDLDALATGSVVPAKVAAKPHGADGLPDTPAFVLPAFVPREGVPLAFVPYPPAAEQRRERGGRKAQPVTKVDEEGEEPPPGGQPGYHGHGGDKDPSGGDTGNPESQGNGNRDALSKDQDSQGDANAQDFYWRMADWS